MITIFSIPKAFEGSIDILQRNAIRSWIMFVPEAEIILFGHEKGVREFAESNGLRHFPDIKTNEFGTPLVSAAFSSAQQIASNPVIMYINSDIILLSRIAEVLKSVKNEHFFVIGRRVDLDRNEGICFDDNMWPGKIMREAAQKGKLHGYSGIDYMIFKKNLPLNMPSFAVGRPGWDNWVLWRIKQSRIPIIDATRVITAIHQNHDYKHSRYGQKERVGGPETIRNYQLAGGYKCMISIREADWLLTGNGLIRPPFMRRVFSFCARYELWQFLVSIKRKVQSFLDPLSGTGL